MHTCACVCVPTKSGLLFINALSYTSKRNHREHIQSQNMKNDFSSLFIFISVFFLHCLHQDNSQSLLSYIVAYYLRHFDEVGWRNCLFHWLNQPRSLGSLGLSTSLLLMACLHGRRECGFVSHFITFICLSFPLS